MAQYSPGPYDRAVPTPLVLDPSLTTIRIRTFAEGLFSRLAHDLELGCRDVRGTAERGDDVAREGTARIEVPIGGLHVAGTVKDGRLDASGLSPSERADCLAKMRNDVFQAKDERAAIRIEAELAGGRARMKLVCPNGRTLDRAVTLKVAAVEGGSTRVSGTIDVSLAAIGSAPVKGPMNAFRVKDVIQIAFDLVFVEAVHGP